MEHIEPENENDDNRIAWHSGFFGAIQLELMEYKDDLVFLPEQQLNTEPLRIDVIIVKKSSDVLIKKNIARIFRKVNIIEYKSPEDYVSVKDFYKVYAYAYLYMALNDIDISDLTLTFVESRHPRELLSHLRETRKFSVANPETGVYTVIGDILPIQIIDSRKLTVEENIWLKDLSNELPPLEIQRIDGIIAGLGKDPQILAYLDVIIRANPKNALEVYRMKSGAQIMAEMFEKEGLNKPWIDMGEARGIVKGEARGQALGQERKALEIAGNMLRDGFPVEQISRLSGLDIAKIKALSA